MKNKLYKLTSILLSLTLVCSMFAILPTKTFAAEVDNDNVSANANADEVSADVDDNSVSSAETFTSGDYKYTKNDDGTVTISEYDEPDSELEIPDTIDGYTVTAIGEQAFHVYDANSVIIPGSVKSIGYRAFYGCAYLKSVIIENGSASSVSIGDWAFAECWSLENITLSYSVTVIGNHAFESTHLKSINIPDSVVTIGDGAFHGENISFKSIIIPPSVESIGEYAFANLDSKLENITFLEGGTSKLTIKRCAFSGCKAKNLVFPDRDMQIGEDAFSSLESLESVEFTGGKIALGECVFQYSSVKNIVFSPNCTISIDGCAFKDCDKVESIIFPENVTELGGAAFYNCKSLKSITIPGSVKKIYSGTFESCENLESVTFEEGITSIGDHVFLFCINLQNVDLPSTLTSIGQSAFLACHKLKTITIPDNVTDINDHIGDIEIIACNRGSCAMKYVIEKASKNEYHYDIITKYKILDAIAGDTDLDGKVDIKDATRLQMAISGVLDNDLEYTLMDNFNDVADLNKDEKRDVNDVTLIQKMIAVYAAK